VFYLSDFYCTSKSKTPADFAVFRLFREFLKPQALALALQLPIVASNRCIAERFIMVDAQLPATVPVKACGACSGGLLERDKFCRWCGSPQTYSLSPLAGCQHRISLDHVSQDHVSQDRLSQERPSQGREPSAPLSLSPYRTLALNRAGIEDRSYRRVSGPLVKALVAGVSRGRAAEPSGRVVRSLVQALVSVPIWLMIVLLSPFDAYVAAKSISRDF
jgi:hypothetical protein